MKIKREFRPRMAIEKFADKHGLVMVVNERPKRSNLPRFYARFEDAEISEPGVLISTFGDGNTEEEAIEDYARQISEQTLVVDAYGINRKEIEVPILVED